MNRMAIYLSITFLVLLSFALSLMIGSSHQFIWSFGSNDAVLLQLRLPRTLSAFVSGGLLGMAGALMQLLLQNPLADPYVLGISGGATFGILLCMIISGNETWMLPAGWLGSLLTIFLTIALAKKHRFKAHSLLLIGIALSCGFSACISFLLMLGADTRLRTFLFWLTGDLNDANYPWLATVILLFGLLNCMIAARGFNVLMRGEQAACALGLPVARYRFFLYLLGSLFTATAVSLAGSVGFVGLIVPHLVRLLFGYDQRIVLPLSLLLGGSLVTFADTLARTVLAPQQIPVGLVLAFMGVPIFIGLLHKVPG